jgi:hypothetical protein
VPSAAQSASANPLSSAEKLILFPLKNHKKMPNSGSSIRAGREKIQIIMIPAINFSGYPPLPYSTAV